MVKKTLIIILLSIIIFSSNSIYSQTGGRSEGATRHLSKWEKRFGEVNYKGNIYRQGSNWISFGFGPSYKIGANNWNQSFSLSYHYRFRGVYFNLGWHYSTSKLIGFRPIRILHQMDFLNDIHLGAGLRVEGRWHHIGFFICPSWAFSLIPSSDSNHSSEFHNNLGVVINTEIIFKYLYDMGVGVNIFGSFNKRTQLAGVQLRFYFSNAFITKY